MKATDEQLLQKALAQVAETWALARVLVEHERSYASPSNREFDEQQILTLKLIEQFPGQVTVTTIRKVFDLHYSQAGKIVQPLIVRNILKDSGRGQPLELTTEGKEVVKKIQAAIGNGFAYAYRTLDTDDLHHLLDLLAKVHKATREKVETQVFMKNVVIL